MAQHRINEPTMIWRSTMIKVTRHEDIPGESRGPGVTRKLTVDKSTGAGAVTTGIVYLEPGGTIRPHTHLIEEAMTLVEGKLKILVGNETTEVEAGTSWHAPATPSTAPAMSATPRRS